MRGATRTNNFSHLLVNVWNWVDQRLRLCLCRKVGPEMSTGIRPLLLDLQGLHRDEERCTPEAYARTCTNEQLVQRIQELMGQLQTLCKLCQTKNAFVVEKNSTQTQQHHHHRNTSSSTSSNVVAELEVPSSMIRECTSRTGHGNQVRRLVTVDARTKQVGVGSVGTDS